MQATSLFEINTSVLILEILPKETFLKIMSQYVPYYKATEYPEINSSITREECEEVVCHARALGLTNLEIQGYYRF